MDRPFQVRLVVGRQTLEPEVISSTMRSRRMNITRAIVNPLSSRKVDIAA